MEVQDQHTLWWLLKIKDQLHCTIFCLQVETSVLKQESLTL